MKLSEMNKGDNKVGYFIHIWDKDKNMWVPYINNYGYSFFGEDYLIYNLAEVKKLNTVYKVFRQTTSRVE